ncbi:major facilitator superfamily domain-containing protein [Xylariaceae sp. FL0255]|nr:major facilitator superfamily domain-containing protein [Xylariaceae sp. FL0255]
MEGLKPADPKMHNDLFNGYVPDTEEEKRLVRKIDLFLLPTIYLMYLLSYVDRCNIGNAKVAGLQADLHLTSDQYSISLVVFFVSYVVFDVSSDMVLSRSRPSIFLPAIILVGIRIVIGILEAGFAPDILLLLSSWHKKSEQSKRFAVYISAAILSGALGGLLAGATTKGLDGAHGIAGWRWLFILEGAATAGWSIIAKAERKLAIRRVIADQVRTGTEDTRKLTSLQALKMALSYWRVWLFVVDYMAIVGSSTLTYFYPIVVNNVGYSAHESQYLTIPIYIAAFVVNGFTGYFMDKIRQYRGYMLTSWMTVAMVRAIATTVVYNFHARYSLLVIIASSLLAGNDIPNEIRAISLAFVNATGNLAQIYGAYLFPSSDASEYILGFGVISGLCFTGVVSYLALQVVLKSWPQ